MAERNRKENILLRLYSTGTLALEFLVLLIKVFYATLEAIFDFIFPKPLKSVRGEIVLVTGAGNGIGREVAIKFTELGSTVVCLDVDENGNEQTVKLIQDNGYQNVHAYKCDVTKREEILLTVEKIKKDVGDVTILINNAGIMSSHLLLDHKPQEITKIFEVNVLAHFWFLEVVLPNMIKKNHGHVVAISSMAGLLGIRNLVPYCASKYAVRGLMEALIEEFREEKIAPGVHFTIVCPYMVNTGLCKNPRVNEKFGDVVTLLSPKKVAEDIVTSMRKNKTIITIPPYLWMVYRILNFLPIKAEKIIVDFLDCGMYPD